MPLHRKRIRLLPALAFLAAGLVQAGDSRIELTDGSVVTGELVGIQGGHYRIHSQTLGDLSIPEASIRSLQPAGAATASASSSQAQPDYSGQIASIQKQLVMDESLRDQVTALQQDPEIQQLLSDPELTRMILSGDIQRLQSDARIQRLMRHPAVQAITGQVMGR